MSAVLSVRSAEIAAEPKNLGLGISLSPCHEFRLHRSAFPSHELVVVDISLMISCHQHIGGIASWRATEHELKGQRVFASKGDEARTPVWYQALIALFLELLKL